MQPWFCWRWRAVWPCSWWWGRHESNGELIQTPAEAWKWFAKEPIVRKRDVGT